MMALRITVTNAYEIRQGIWSFDMPPHQVRHFGNTNNTIGIQSVLIFRTCEYDAAVNQLYFDIEDVTPVNIGTSSRVIGIAAAIAGNPTLDHQTASPSMPAVVGPGDREFLRLTRNELSKELAQTAEQLLLGVRERSSGDLKRGQARNFSETPDNFWYIIVQPRIDELSVTVRGPVKHFEDITALKIKDDRGNTLFKIRSEGDVMPALKLIFHALRKS